MPVPKRRHSRQRTHTRRAHHAISMPKLVECDNCGEQKLPHRVCPACGHYKKVQYQVAENLFDE